MRAMIIICLLAVLAIPATPVAAQDAEALRKELAQAPPSPTDLLRRREPFALAERTGGGRLLFDIGIAADFVANITQHNVDKADAGTFAGRENRFFPREIELSLFGQIDPYARGEVRLEAAEEFEDGERVTEVGLAEAHLTVLTLPFGAQAKMGLMRNRFGLLNERHREALPQPDVPNVLLRFFGEEGLVEPGLEFTWVPPLPFCSRGDVHPEGDPHYTLDPASAEVVTASIVQGLARVAPPHAATFEARRRDFLARLDAAVARWRKTLEPFRGAKVVTYHATFAYFLRRFGLELAGTIEDRPGIPPSPTHLAQLIRTIREQRIKVIVAEPYADRKVVELAARDSGVRALVLPSAVGGVKGVDSYLDLMEHLVTTLAEALR